MEKLSLGRIYYPVTVLGPGKRVGIWLRGCPRRCPGCISPELREYDPEREFAPGELLEMISRITGEIDGFTISGGEPFYRPAALRELMEGLSLISDDILIYTGFTLEELRARNSGDIERILELSAVIIDGEYIRELNDGIGLRGSSNQGIHIFRYDDRYAGIGECERRLQAVRYGEGLLLLGVPGKTAEGAPFLTSDI